jgi:membrane associated rhomboid family serine protease
MFMNKHSQINVLSWTLIITIPFIFQYTGIINTQELLTSKSNGWWSILTGPLLHGSPTHFAGNITGLVLGVSLLLNMYSKRAYWMVIILGFILPSIVMYATGLRSLGISGLVFTVIWFIIYRGMLSSQILRKVIGVLMLILYGSTLASAFPKLMSNVAWQSHMCGVVLAIFLALYDKIRLKN